jgi:hypothetical protein
MIKKGVRPQLMTYGTCRLAPSTPSTPLRKVDDQRQERMATARLAEQIQELVPDLSEADIGRLVGVSRIAWRDWATATRVARRSSRQRLLRLRRILELRQRTDPDTPVSHWLDTPIGTQLDVTPARLLAEGRDQLVAILAARSAPPMADEGGLLAPMSGLAEMVDLEHVDERFRARRELIAVDDEEGED